MRYTQCIFYWFWNVAVRRLLLHFSYFVERSGHCLLYEFQSGKMFWRQSFWLHLVHLFSSKNPPKIKLEILQTLWIFVLFVLLIASSGWIVFPMWWYIFYAPLCALQSGNRVDHTLGCLSENMSWFILTVESNWRFALTSRCERTGGFNFLHFLTTSFCVV